MVVDRSETTESALGTMVASVPELVMVSVLASVPELVMLSVAAHHYTPAAPRTRRHTELHQ